MGKNSKVLFELIWGISFEFLKPICQKCGTLCTCEMFVSDQSHFLRYIWREEEARRDFVRNVFFFRQCLQFLWCPSGVFLTPKHFFLLETSDLLIGNIRGHLDIVVEEKG